MKAVIFDLDGTLVDSAAALCANANRFMAEKSLPPFELAEAKEFIGHGARWFLEQALRARNVPLDEQAFEQDFARFQELYALIPGDANIPYPGVDALLAKLARRDDVRLALCTNKPRVPTDVVLDAHGWTPHFVTVIAGDDLEERKPHPMPLLTASRRTGATSAIYIGDSEVDAETAQAANIPFLLYADGYRKSPVEAIAASAVFTDHDMLIDLIDRF